MKKFWAILIAIAFLAIAAMPVMAQAPIEDRLANIEKQVAACWKFYGSVRIATFYNRFNPKDNNRNDGGTGYKDKGTTWLNQNNSRIGARVALGDISGHFEYAQGGSAADSSPLATRLLYGAWNFGPGSIVVGQDYTPIYWDVTTRVYGEDNQMYGFGQYYGGREAQIKLIYGAFQFAMIDPRNGVSTHGNSTALLSSENYSVYLPRFEASYDLNFGALTGRVMAGFKTFSLVENKDRLNEDKESVSSYIFALGLKYAPGPFSAGLSTFYAQNVGNYAGNSMSMRSSNNPLHNGVGLGAGTSGYKDVNLGGDSTNCKTLGLLLALGYKVNDMVSFNVGYGIQEDKWKLDPDSKKFKAQAYFINMPLTIAKNFWITPEIGIENFKAKKRLC